MHVFGQRDYSMRVWVDPDKLAARNLTAGRRGRRASASRTSQVAARPDRPSRRSSGQQLAGSRSARMGRLVDVEAVRGRDRPSRPAPTAASCASRDIGRVELGARSEDIAQPLRRQADRRAGDLSSCPTPNALETADACRAKMEELTQTFPTGVEYAIGYDTTPFIRESIHEVFKTHARRGHPGRDRRARVPARTGGRPSFRCSPCPVAIVGTFAAMAAVGFSLNNLTLFGLVLAIGIVVDDAIVVVEAVEHHIEQGCRPRDATVAGDGGGLGAGDRGRPGAARGVHSVRVHLGHRRAVLPPVRADDRRLDGDLDVQLADAQPGPGGAPAAAANGAKRDPLTWLLDLAARLVLPAVQLRRFDLGTAATR